jgi:hypothetical protein
MKQTNKHNSIIENLKDTKHNKKANTVFLKLLAKQKSNRRDWKDLRAETLPAENEIKPKISTES